MSRSTDPQGGGSPKSDPESLTLRARPRSVARFNRRVLIGISAVGCVVIFGATLIALNPPSFRGAPSGEELYNVDRKPTAEGLEGLPRTYGDIPRPPPPQLGPPLPGDMGPPVVRMEHDLGVAPLPSTTSDLSFRPDPEADAERAERLRLARQAQQARESGVFFQISMRREGAGAEPEGVIAPTALQETAMGEPEGQRKLELDPERDPNYQNRKQEFLNQRVDREVYNPHPLQDPASPYQVMAGTVIPASLVTGINSDLPGLVIARVTENVYDTVSGHYLLIPQGTRLIGKYDSVVAFGQSRALVIWSRLIMPDGSSTVIENLPATDAAGYAGLEDEVDFHTWRLIKGVVFATLLGVGTELSLGGEESDLVQALRESTCILYDCFGNGQYRNASGYRHRHKDALVQIANELAAKSLCHLLIPTPHADASAYVRAFVYRIGQAATLVRLANSNALLCIVVDAADNAQMAAEEIGETRSFVRDLIREKMPEGVRLVFLCRSHRQAYLDPPVSAIRLELQPFTRDETTAYLRHWFPEASEHDIDEFHRLSSQNPRVQALALTRKMSLPETLRLLGPNPTTVEDTIGGLLEGAIAKLRDSVGPVEKTQVDKICTGLAALRPLIPIPILAQMSGVDEDAIKSFAIDIGRPLLVSGDTIQFFDEPAETWFREKFKPSASAMAEFLASLNPRGKHGFAYASRSASVKASVSMLSAPNSSIGSKAAMTCKMENGMPSARSD